MKISFDVNIENTIAFSEILVENDIKNKIVDVDADSEIISIDVNFNSDNKGFIQELMDLAEVE
ncbi:MAG TPA: hypothetical protein PKN32_06230 [Bacteroidales bacterium]|nr:hypothetical protein [Bacteroidales bacterium]